jgi:hypothetical protein
MRISGVLQKINESNFIVISGENRWRVLNASVTYYRGKAGDEVVLLVPKAGGSAWGAVDNIIRNELL